MLLTSAIDHVAESYGALSFFRMVSTSVILENLKHNFLIVIGITKSICIQENLVPRVPSTKDVFGLRFENWLVFTRSFESIDDNETISIWKTFCREGESCLSFTIISFFLFGCYFKLSGVLSSWVGNCTCELLIS